MALAFERTTRPSWRPYASSSRISVYPWDEEAAEAHARIRVGAKRLGRSAGALIRFAQPKGLGLKVSDGRAALRYPPSAEPCHWVEGLVGGGLTAPWRLAG
jgi:hypothetical protein